MKKTFILLALCLAAGTFAAELLTIKSARDFFPNKALNAAADIYTISAPGNVMGIKKLKLDPAKKYTISADVRITPGTKKPYYVYLNLCPFTKRGRRFAPENVGVILGTDTILAKEAKAGDDTLILKNAAKWDNKNKYAYAAFGTREDFADLPNFNVLRTITGSIEEEDGLWHVTLAAPLKKSYPAGTKIRQHISGGTFIRSIWMTPSFQWQTIHGTVSGAVLKYGRSDKQLWPGTDTVRLVLSVAGKDSKVDFRNIKITEAQ